MHQNTPSKILSGIAISLHMKANQKIGHNLFTLVLNELNQNIDSGHLRLAGGQNF